MAYHFRKLRQTLRLVPSTKPIGFSTRINEGEQSKSPCADNPPSNLPCNNPASIASCGSQNVGEKTEGQKQPPSLYRSLSDSDVFSTCHRNLPISYDDVVQIFLPKIPPGTDLIACSAEGENHSVASPTLSFLRSVKAVHFTHDDILAQPYTASADISCKSEESENAPNSDSLPSFTFESIPSTILVDNYRRRHHQTTQINFDASPVINTNHRVCMDHAALSNRGIINFSSRETPEGATPEMPSDPNQSNPVLSSGGSGSSGNDKTQGPSPEQLHNIRPRLENMVSRLFSGRHDYGILHKSVVMENNLFGENKSSVGVTSYAMELMKMRMRIHARYSNVSVEIMSVTTLENNGVVRIHWRLKGLPQIQLLKFWRLFHSRESVSKDDWEWLEAFSYFHIGKDGLVHKHRIDRMMPDNDAETDKLTDKLRGLLHQPKPLVS